MKQSRNNLEMKLYSRLKFRIATFTILSVIVAHGTLINAQQSIGFGIHANPTVGWLSSDNSDITGEGARAGFNFGLTFNKYFTENYAFSTGISLITAGGSLADRDTSTLELNRLITVLPGSKMIYNIKYLVIPIGLKLKSKQIGYVTIFTDLGLDPKFTIGGKVEIPSQNIPKEKAVGELKKVSLGYHIIGGIEYSLGGTTAIVLGINFDSNFTDITKENRNQRTDKIVHKLLGFHLGLNF